MEQNYLNQAYSAELPADFCGNVKWQSPSNIALVKYWGKKGKQLPQNPSISFTLSNCRTETSVVIPQKISIIIKIKNIIHSKVYIALSVIIENIEFKALDK